MALGARDDDGFTLVELLVVATTLLILAGIAIPVFMGQRQRGFQAQMASDVHNAVMQLEAASVEDSGRYPADQAAFDALGARVSSPSITLTYNVNGTRTRYCVEAQDARVDAPNDTAIWVTGSGLEKAAVCPAL